MSERTLKQIVETFPWTETVTHTPVGGLVRMIDNKGAEVPLFDMTFFLMKVTAKIHSDIQKSKPAAPMEATPA